MKTLLRKRLVNAALAITAAAAGAAATHYAAQDPPEILLAWELGAHFESGGRHIGTPYVDKIGRGQPLTVCNGVTGPDVMPGRYYTPDDCKRMELSRYRAARKDAARMFTHWGGYNVWVRASILDMLYNLGAPAVEGSTLLARANAGDLAGACEQMPRWVYGTVAGQRTRLPGLVDRRDATRELCAEWGRDGHFSAGLIAEAGR